MGYRLVVMEQRGVNYAWGAPSGKFTVVVLEAVALGERVFSRRDVRAERVPALVQQLEGQYRIVSRETA